MNKNALSFDVEDYFQVAVFRRSIDRGSWDGFERRVTRNVDRILAILAETEKKATFFVLGWVAEREPSLIRSIRDGGHEIASHGYWHQRIMEGSRDAFREDIRSAKAVLEGITGVEVRGYRAPSFSITRETLWALDVLLEEGYGYDSSVFPTRHPDYGIPDAPCRIHRLRTPGGRTILEFPMSVAPSPWPLPDLPVSGGGWFRLLPFFLTRWGFKAINRSGRPGIFYLHPWEIDTGQPRLADRTTGLGAFRHYVNLASTERKLRSLLKEFPFTTLADVLSRHEGTAPLVDLMPRAVQVGAT